MWKLLDDGSLFHYNHATHWPVGLSNHPNPLTQSCCQYGAMGMITKVVQASLGLVAALEDTDVKIA